MINTFEPQITHSNEQGDNNPYSQINEHFIGGVMEYISLRTKSTAHALRANAARLAVTAVSGFGVGSAALAATGGEAAASSAKLKLVTPTRLLHNAISFDDSGLYYVGPANVDQTGIGDGTLQLSIHYNNLVLGPHYFQLQLTTPCDPSYDAGSPIFERRDLQGQYERYCNAPGQIPSPPEFTPQSQMKADTKLGQEVDFMPVLIYDADSAALSAGLQTDQFGTPTKLTVDVHNAKTQTATINYSQGTTAGVRQLKQLDLTIKNGKEVAHEVWYR